MRDSYSFLIGAIHLVQNALYKSVENKCDSTFIDMLVQVEYLRLCIDDHLSETNSYEEHADFASIQAEKLYRKSHD